LSAGESDTALADLGVVLVRKAFNVIVYGRSPAGILDLGICRFKSSVADVLPNGLVCER